jgi:hypothetical protein
MGDCPITVTSIGCLFLFRVVGPGEMSSVTWGFEKAKGKGQGKSFPLTSHHRSESLAKQPIKDNKKQKCTCPEQSNIKLYLQGHLLVSTSCNQRLSQIKQLTDILMKQSKMYSSNSHNTLLHNKCLKEASK